jgi:hypothetical protein
LLPPGGGRDAVGAGERAKGDHGDYRIGICIDDRNGTVLDVPNVDRSPLRQWILSCRNGGGYRFVVVSMTDTELDFWFVT